MRYVTSRPGKNGPRWYWQRKAYEIERLSDDEHERYLRARELNEAADAGALPAKPPPKEFSEDTVAGVIASYRTTDRYTKLGQGTKIYYDRWLDEFKTMWGPWQVRRIDQQLCLKYLESIDSLGERRKARAVLRVVLDRAKALGKLPDNPTDGIEIGELDPRQVYFTEDELARFAAGALKHRTHGPMVYLGFLLLLFTGQRPGDMLSMTWKQYNGRTLRLRQEKTDKWVEVPVHPQLKPLLDDARAKTSSVFILTHAGQPVSEKTLNFRFNQVKRRPDVNLPDHQTRDLRRTAVVRMAEAGAELQDIAAVTGHSIERTKKILEVYLPRTLKMAERGVERMPYVSLTIPG